MNKYQRETEQILLNHEQQAYDQLKKTYANALKEIKIHIRDLQQDIDILERANPDNKSLIRSKIYQLNYQKAMEEQLNSVIEMLKTSNTKTTQSFLTKMYEDSFLSTNYNLQKQGIPVIMPINHKKIINVINMPTEKLNFKDRTYKNVEELKKVVKAEISRGIAVGSSYNEMARQISLLTEADYNKAKRIVRTEGGRVSSQARQQSIIEAKKRGADLVKVWDATLDMKTRSLHLQLDGQWAEVEKPFKVGTTEVMAPHEFGDPAEDINCRCVLLSMPRWDLEDTYVKRDNITGELIECSNYQDWKNKYYNVINSENFTKGQLKQFIYDKKTNSYYERNAVAGLPELDEVRKVVREAEERILDYQMEAIESISYKVADTATKDNMQEISNKVFSEMDNDVKTTVTDYTYTYYREINRDLMENKGDINQFSELDRAKIGALDKATNSMEIAEDIIVYKTSSYSYYARYALDEEFVLDIYNSTSLNKSSADEFLGAYRYDAVNLEIRVPKGTKGLYIGENTNCSYNEYELLLPRGLTYKIVDNNYDGEVPKLILEVVKK